MFLNLRCGVFLSLGYFLVHAAADTPYCLLVEAVYPARVIWPETSAYNAAQKSYYSGQEQALKPDCIFTPHTTEEVSQFVKILTAGVGDFESKTAPRFAIRGGGHSVFAGAANIENGITVDMRHMNAVGLSDDKQVASIGAGGMWSEIYPELEKHNLTVAGGRVAGVGVGGYLTGGGISYLSRRHGWACDLVLGYEVVLASGEIFYASAGSHRDLWLALKGGSNNFGLVTRFDVPTFENAHMWGGTMLFEYSETSLSTLAIALSSFMDLDNFDDAASLFVALFYLNGAWASGTVLFYVEPEADPPVFRNFTDIPDPQHNTLRLTTVSDVATEQASTLPPEANRAINNVWSFQSPSAAVYSELFKAWEDGVKDMTSIKGLSVNLLIQPHPVSTGMNSLGLTPGGKDMIISVITISYSDKSDDEAAQKGAEAIAAKEKEILSREGVLLPFQYLNYADKISQNPIKSYGKGVEDRLQKTSRKYDPKGVFQHAVPGGFKLFEAECQHAGFGAKSEL